MTVGISARAQGQGIGTALLERLIAESEADGYWTLQAQMITDNHPSLTLHRKCGFREVGYRERYGHIENSWHDVGLTGTSKPGNRRARPTNKNLRQLILPFPYSPAAYFFSAS